jgi:hypothetical protein
MRAIQVPNPIPNGGADATQQSAITFQFFVLSLMQLDRRFNQTAVGGIAAGRIRDVLDAYNASTAKYAAELEAYVSETRRVQLVNARSSEQFQQALAVWQRECLRVDNDNARVLLAYDAAKAQWAIRCEELERHNVDAEAQHVRLCEEIHSRWVERCEELELEHQTKVAEFEPGWAAREAWATDCGVLELAHALALETYAEERATFETDHAAWLQLEPHERGELPEPAPPAEVPALELPPEPPLPVEAPKPLELPPEPVAPDAPPRVAPPPAPALPSQASKPGPPTAPAVLPLPPPVGRPPLLLPDEDWEILRDATAHPSDGYPMRPAFAFAAFLTAILEATEAAS